MSSEAIIGVLAALGTGLAIGMQATLTGRAGGIIGSTRTGLVTNFLGGVIAGLLILVLFIRQGPVFWKLPNIAILMAAISGTLGIVIITGVSYSLQRVGVAAGLASIFLGQMIVSVLVDTSGVGDVEPIPLSVSRIAGILLMGAAVYLVLPRN